MSEETRLKFYSVAIAALRTADGQTAIGVQSAVALLPEGVTIEEAGLAAARSFFPESEGWGGHHVTATEIPRELTIESYTITWREKND